MAKLSDAEWKIMELLWDKGPLTTMEITRELENSIGWSKSTVITLLKRMEAKATIHFETDNKSKLYFHDVEKKDAELQETKSFLDKFYSGNLGLMVSNLISNEALSQEEIDELNRIINKGK